MYIDQSTKIILVVMAAGIWLNALNPWLELIGAYRYGKRLKQWLPELFEQEKERLLLSLQELLEREKERLLLRFQQLTDHRHDQPQTPQT